MGDCYYWFDQCWAKAKWVTLLGDLPEVFQVDMVAGRWDRCGPGGESARARTLGTPCPLSPGPCPPSVPPSSQTVRASSAPETMISPARPS